jgi:uncharacterized phage protein gp47/JayE
MATNSIGATGITIQGLLDILAELNAGMQAIYGSGININPNSPDGQMINLFAQAKLDVLEMILAVATSFDPDQATGVLLDQRVAINGVVREPGTYTQQAVSVTVSQAVTLPGLDLSPSSPFTVADSTGNQYQLVTTYAFGGAGTASLTFQGATIGAISSPANTITVPVTILAGVTTINNPSVASFVGVDEEPDVLLRIRRTNSTALPSQGFLAGMIGAIMAVNGVTQVAVFENQTPAVNGYGMPANSVWIIVAGDPVAAQVAAAIYAKRHAGTPQMNAGAGGVGTASLSGTAVNAIANTNAGNGYFNAPGVKLVGGGGAGALAHTTVDGSGHIASYVIDAGGTGYTSAPTVELNPNTVATAVTQLDSTVFTIFYDTPVAEALWFQATLTAITGALDRTWIAAQILAQFGSSYRINQAADTASIVAFIKSIAPNASVASEGVSTTGSGFSNLVTPTGVNYQFTIPDVSHITIS